jgi:hypothetical protein
VPVHDGPDGIEDDALVTHGGSSGDGLPRWSVGFLYIGNQPQGEVVMTDRALDARCSGDRDGITCWVRDSCERWHARGDNRRRMATHRPDPQGKGCWWCRPADQEG